MAEKIERISFSCPSKIAAYVRNQHNMSEYIRNLVVADIEGKNNADLLSQIRNIIREAVCNRTEVVSDISIDVVSAIDSLIK